LQSSEAKKITEDEFKAALGNAEKK
ncbi:MAG: hypothetical protein H6Q42_2128, partial [Deltaproteobacteria bacterium]|nr:hypothetical protein [Deltaproteobacteria bacterium]